MIYHNLFFQHISDDLSKENLVKNVILQGCMKYLQISQNVNITYSEWEYCIVAFAPSGPEFVLLRKYLHWYQQISMINNCLNTLPLACGSHFTVEKCQYYVYCTCLHTASVLPEAGHPFCAWVSCLKDMRICNLKMASVSVRLRI